jgi:hypothetical protein
MNKPVDQIETDIWRQVYKQDYIKIWNEIGRPVHNPASQQILKELRKAVR